MNHNQNMAARFKQLSAFLALLCFFFGCKISNYTVKSEWEEASPEMKGMDSGQLQKAGHYASGSGIIMRGGKVVFQWGDIDKLYDLKSTTKSIGVIALGLAIKDRLVDLNDQVKTYFAEFGNQPKDNLDTGWMDEITFLHLATHTSGFDKTGGYVPLLYKSGTAWAYSDGGPNWLADSLTLLYGLDLKDLMFERVFTPLGISSSDLKWRDNAYREDTIQGIKRREFGSGIKANVKAMIKIGSLFLYGGEWNGQQIISKKFIQMVRRPVPSIKGLPVKNDYRSIFAGASEHYGLLWWNNGDGAMPRVTRDAFWSWGLYDSVIAVIPSLNIVIARAGDSLKGDRQPSFYRIFEPFIEPIIASVNQESPCPNSPVISSIAWDDKSKIERKAKGSDNWPLTWADDDNLYTAYGDGYGFKPKISKKLSMGFARIVGTTEDFLGENIRSGDEQYGDGRSGKKASGMLMVDGILYMWVRNANNKGEGSQLAWSIDHGISWKWSPWRFKEFGYCTFINFGKNYEGARDNFVYTVTHDHTSAYKRADRFILMRAPKERMTARNAWEFFKLIGADGKPVWTKNMAERGAVFQERGRCFRSGISYNSALGRYIWWQAKYPDGIDGKYDAGMFGVFDAPEPWGPWTTVYYTDNWDVGAGETGSFPPKWMSDDGKTMHLVFSGDDAFSVRKATLTQSPPSADGTHTPRTGSKIMSGH